MTADPDVLRRFYRLMLLCRRFEEKAAQVYGMEKIRGFCHLYIGQEAVAVGSILAARDDDYVITAYRDHAHALVRGTPPAAVMAELYGRKDGMSGGFGGSMHLFDASRRFMGGHGIVGGHTPMAAGMSFASRYKGEDTVTLCYLGDAAVNQGVFHESMNLAALWKLPVIYIVENNLYGMGTALNRALAGDMVARAAAYGMPADSVDGMDVEAVYERTRQAIELARTDGTPTFIEARCYRYRGHSMSDPATYRTREEVEQERRRDPINRLRTKMIEQGIESEQWFKAVDKEIRREVKEAEQEADRSPRPDPSLVDAYVYI